MSNDIDKYREILKEDAGNPAFADLAEQLRSAGKHQEGIEVCLAGLSANPGCHRGRLVLARIFYEKSYYPFALQELETLARELPGNATIAKLIDKLAPGRSAQVGSRASGEVQTLAETELDFSAIDLIGQKEES